MVQSVSHYSGSTYATTAGETRRACIRNLPGFLSNSSVNVLDSSLIPDVRVTIYWATNATLSKANGVGDTDFVLTTGVTSVSSSFTINDCFACIDTISIASDVYGSMVDMYMKGEEQCIKISFPDYTTIHDSGSIIRFSVASNSLDRVLALWCNDAQSSPVPIDGTALSSNNYDTPTTSSSDKLFQSAYVNSVLPSSATTLQLTCNSSQFPQHE
eukprot:6141819-Pleurochrysis_carterae.AAC.1